MKKTLCVLVLTFAVVAPALADDPKTIAQRLDDKWIEAFNKKDAAALTALYTANAVLLPQGKDQPIIGANNIRNFMDGMIKEKIENLVLPVAEANMLDQKSLYQAGTWAADVGGQHVTGTYMSVGRRRLEISRRHMEHDATSCRGSLGDDRFELQ
jgi:uncharacterized protein (TIGR02246 family)